MAQTLKNINVVAPGFQGINTEDSSLALDPSFAVVADNAIIDRFGRLASRKGHVVQTTDKTELGTASIEVIHEHEDSAGTVVIFSAGNNKILSGTNTLVDETPATYTITDNNWDIVSFNDSCYFFQRGHEPLVYSNSSGSVEKMSDVSGYGMNSARTHMDGNTVLAAFGRLWVADFTDDKHTIYWSDLLQGHVWNGGSSGSIDISKVWPDGYDEIVKLVAHNNLLIIFGKHSIVVYEGADSPATMQLVDTVNGVGARCRCAVAHIGTDVLFMAYNGLRSFGRAIQEKALPLTDLSRNIKQDLLEVMSNETKPFRMVYSPENNFVLVTFRNETTTFCFDIRGTLQNGSYRVTRWPGTGFKGYCRKSDGTLLIGTTDGISEYRGYSDNNESYRFKYTSPNLDFGDSSVLKILKKFRPTLIGGQNNIVVSKWGYDFFNTFKTRNLQLTGSQSLSYFNEDEFNVAEFSSGNISVRETINTTGSGFSVIVGLESDINGEAISLQEYSLLTLIGKII